jgi:hypothetical protein
MKTEPNPIIAGLQQELSDATRNANNMREHLMKDLTAEHGTETSVVPVTSKLITTPMLRALYSGYRAANQAEKYTRQMLRHVERYVS